MPPKVEGEINIKVAEALAALKKAQSEAASTVNAMEFLGEATGEAGQAMYDQATAAKRLEAAQTALAGNDLPEAQSALAQEVLKARTAVEKADASVEKLGDTSDETGNKSESFLDNFERGMRTLNDVLDVANFAIEGVAQAIDAARASAERLGRTELPTALDRASKAGTRLGDSLATLPIGKMIPVFQVFGDEAIKNADAITILTRAADGLASGANYLTAAWIKYQAETGQITWEEAARQIDDLTGAVADNRTEASKAADAINTYADRWAGLAAAVPSPTAQANIDRWLEMRNAEDAAIRIGNITSAMTDLRIVMGGAVDNEMESFRTKQDELKTKAAEYQQTIDTLSGKSYLNSTQRQELADAKKGLDELKTEYANEAAAHEERTKRIIFDLVSQRLAQNATRDGTSEFTADEAALLDGLAEKWGLTGALTGTVLRGIDTALGDAAASGNWDAAETSITNLGNSVSEVLTPAVDGMVSSLDESSERAELTKDKLNGLNTTPFDLSNVKVSLDESAQKLETTKGKADDLKTSFDQLQDKSITITTNYVTRGSPGSGGQQPVAFADGGPVTAGTYGIFNEDPSTRPETFVASKNGYMLTKQDAQAALAGAMGTGQSYTIHVDARGAVDPAAVEAAGYRGAKRALEEAGRAADARRRT